VLTVGVAQPTAAVRVPRDRATVMLAIDVSLSMQAVDVLPNRMDAAKKGAREFVDLLPPRINVGLVKFGGNSTLVVAPTIDRDAVKREIDKLEPEDSTAIGEAIYTCLGSITTFSRAVTAKNDKPPPARIVLLSDGASNKGRSPMQAAAEAKTEGVPVSTIAFGTDTGTVDLPGYGPQPVSGGQDHPAGGGRRHRRHVPQPPLGGGAPLGVREHRLADRLHDLAQVRCLALPGDRAVLHARCGRGLTALVRTPGLTFTPTGRVRACPSTSDRSERCASGTWSSE